jgi:succinate dehydrogenase assembly factor 1
MVLKKSGLQKDVLSLYRRWVKDISSKSLRLLSLHRYLSALRMVNTKPDSVRPKFRLFIRFSFHKSASKVSPRNVSSVEHLLRKGTRQIELYEDPGVKDCWVTDEMIAWNEKHNGFMQRS